MANNCNAFADSGDMVVVMGAISSAVDARVRHANKVDIEDQVKAAEVSAQAVRDATARLKVRAEAAKLKAERMQQTAERIARDMRVVLAQTEDSRASTTSEATASRTAPLLPATSSSGSSALDTGAGIRTGAGTGAGASAIRNGSDRTVSKVRQRRRQLPALSQALHATPNMHTPFEESRINIRTGTLTRHGSTTVPLASALQPPNKHTCMSDSQEHQRRRRSRLKNDIKTPQQQH